MANDRLEELFGFLKADPTDAFTLYSIAYEYTRQSRWQEALAYYSRLKEADPDYLGTYYHMGKALEQDHRQDEAEKVYREGILRARRKGDAHTLSELQGALNKLLGLDFEDEV